MDIKFKERVAALVEVAALVFGFYLFSGLMLAQSYALASLTAYVILVLLVGVSIFKFKVLQENADSLLFKLACEFAFGVFVAACTFFAAGSALLGVLALVISLVCFLVVIGTVFFGLLNSK